MSYSLAGKRVWVAGHRGMVGQALLRRLAREDCAILTVPHSELDLRNQAAVAEWMGAMHPQVVFLAAAKVGGILANTRYPADFIYDNLMITANVVHAAYMVRAERLLVLGSSAVYPRLAPQPMPETALLTGSLEPTHEAYAVAKIAGIKLVQSYRKQYGCDFIAALPTNLFGPGDTFDPEAGHVIPSLIRKVYEAVTTGRSELVMWGTGAARREFLHVDDCADACVHVMHAYSADEPINVGSGKDIAIADVLALIASIAGFSGRVVSDPTKPDGPPRKLMDCTRLNAMGWQPSIDLHDGLAETYRWYSRHSADLSAKVAAGSGARST